jgi:hypothetical protein
MSRLAEAPALDVRVLALHETPSRGTRRLLLGLVEGFLARVLRYGPSALREMRIEALPFAREQLTGRDVILDFAGPGSTTSARYGTWTLTHGLVREEQTHLYRTQIDAHLEDGRLAAIYVSYGATDPTSLRRTRNQALWKAQGAFFRRLETVRRLGLPFIESCPESAGAAADARPAGATRVAFGVAERRLRRLRERETWFIAARPRRAALVAGLEEEPPDGFVPVGLSARRPVADPFVLDEGGETYLFFEEYDPNVGRAHISYVQLDADARSRGPATSALAASYHLSYPFVFRHEGEIFMIPESSSNRTVELYRATEFPSSWTLEQVLLRGVRAFDPTLLEADGRLWLFVSCAEEGAAPNDELHLYTSATLSGPWAAHAANPVVSDARSARPAGRIFHHGEHSIRPSQDCSRRYGYAIVLNRIDVLNDEEYRETPVGRIEPTWLPGLFATHTYNHAENVEVVDGKRLVCKRLFER